MAQQGCFSASGWRGTAGCWQGHHHGHGEPPLSSGEERQAITWVKHQAAISFDIIPS